MKSVMKHQFSRIPAPNIQRSLFDRTHGYKTTFNAGDLVPFYADEVLPGDTFNMRHNIFARLATPEVPIMDNMFLDVFYFFVPNRLIWENWERFNGARDTVGSFIDYEVDFLVPQVTEPAGGWLVGSLSDYLGLPTEVDNGLSVNSLHHRAYLLIYNDWFRHQDIQDIIPVPVDDGPDSDSDFMLLKRNKRHDYFTSCLLWPQKGDAIELPLGDSAPVYGNGKSLGLTDASGAFQEFGMYFENVAYLNAGSNYYNVDAGNDPGSPGTRPGADEALGVVTSGESGLYADLTAATAATVNQLREAFQMQRVLEKDARSGTRYTEFLRAHFGVVSPDFRLQRPEYLGGSSTRIIINPVQQTGPSEDSGGASGTPQGNLAGFGYAADSKNGFTKSFVEHGVILGLVNVRADLTYQRGIPRMFSRQTRWDYYLPSLAHLGEQAVLQKEIFADGSAGDDLVFGYQERWSEYRYFPSQITGKFRSNYATALDNWHLSEDFATAPTLNNDFIQSDPPVERIIAVQDEPHFIFDSYLELKCARCMPVYSVPGLIDHF